MPSGPYAGCHEDAPVPRPWSPQGRHDGTRRGCSWRGMDARSHRCQDAAVGVVVAVTEQDISRGILISIARRWWMPSGPIGGNGRRGRTWCSPRLIWRLRPMA